MIQQIQDQYSIHRLCQVLGVSRSGYYAWTGRVPTKHQQRDAQLSVRIQEVFKAHKGRYGSPRIYEALQQNGEQTSKRRTERLMREVGLVATRARRHKRIFIQRDQQKPAENILSRQFSAQRPNEKWVSDITFIPTRRQGYLYLATVLDLYSRAIVGWSMSGRINQGLVTDAIQMAITQRGFPKRTLVHSDRGSQYTAQVYRNLLKQHDMTCSMSRKGNCHDNAVAESFFKTLKEELVKDHTFEDHAEAKQAIFQYIELYYNRQRLHSTLDYQAPLVYERMHAVA